MLFLIFCFCCFTHDLKTKCSRMIIFKLQTWKKFPFNTFFLLKFWKKCLKRIIGEHFVFLHVWNSTRPIQEKHFILFFKLGKNPEIIFSTIFLLTRFHTWKKKISWKFFFFFFLNKGTWLAKQFSSTSSQVVNTEHKTASIRPDISWTNAVCWLVHSSAASGLRGRGSTRLEGHFSGGHLVSDEEGQGEQHTHKTNSQTYFGYTKHDVRKDFYWFPCHCVLTRGKWRGCWNISSLEIINPNCSKLWRMMTRSQKWVYIYIFIYIKQKRQSQNIH